MKKWIWIVSIVLLICLGIGINIYINALEPLNSAEKKAEEIALKETVIETVTDFSIYNGSRSYYVVKGTNKAGDPLIAWIPEKQDKHKIIVRNEKYGISKEEAIQKLHENKNPDEIITVKLGIENNIPLWEIYYRSNDDQINYYYIDFKTGEWLKDIQNL
ncbi:peptidase [Robertmurraya yapensis]|uniref:Peptidase n=2 Tax=Bacillaceae TaxID=186817 RepID=A0A431W4U0_9BACI|nr:DUF5590 domain-containing protein [Bacillus yapensis]RTR30465.1 peptidase [Bacillus yapensis]TKS95284.1 peptidase [Bacillus yapensis]